MCPFEMIIDGRRAPDDTGALSKAEQVPARPFETEPYDGNWTKEQSTDAKDRFNAIFLFETLPVRIRPKAPLMIASELLIQLLRDIA